MLLGRTRERDLLDRLARDVQAGRGRSLVLVGGAGVGKTSLLEDTAAGRTLFTVLRATGIQSEMELAYAGVQQLLPPDAAAGVPLAAPQREALDVALGLRTGRSDRLLVGLAVHEILRHLAAERPVLCLVDDVQWLDRSSVQVLGFVCRRLASDRVGLLFARRPGGAEGAGGAGDDLAAAPVLEVAGLATQDALALLADVATGPLDPKVAAQLVRDVDGNPLALVELVRSMPPEVLAGGYGLARAPAGGTLESLYRGRVLGLPPAARVLLLLAAADPTGEAALFWRAAAALRVDRDAIAPAVDAGLIVVGAHVRFPHPLARSAAYAAATPSERRRVHGALAEAMAPDADDDRRAWHRALAALGPDEEVAAELERCADRAESRGGLFAAGAFLERATELSADPASMARRALAAARAKELSGASEAALRLVSVAESGPLGPADAAKALHIRGRVALTVRRGADATVTLLEAARRLDDSDPVAAREVYLEAVAAALFTADLGESSPGVAHAATEARGARTRTSVPGPVDALLAAFVAITLDPPHEAAAQVARAVDVWRGDDLLPATALRWSWLAARLTALAWDEQAWIEVTTRGADLARALGSSIALPAVLSSAAALDALRGDLPGAAARVAEAEESWAAVGLAAPPYGRVVEAAWRADEQVGPLLARTEETMRERGEGMGVALVLWARALLANAAGDYAAALLAAEAAAGFPAGTLYTGWALPELVEAAVRTAQPGLAEEAMIRLEGSTRRSTAAWGHGVLARCRALVAPPEAAETGYRESLEALTATPMVADLARTRLLYGEWLRRERRVSEARTQLRAAREVFLAMGAGAFARRAGAETAASGADRPASGLAGALTPQEARVAHLASSGLSNAEIAAQLYVSPSTVDYHLRKVFQKLGIRSRNRLHLVLPVPSASGTGDRAGSA